MFVNIIDTGIEKETRPVRFFLSEVATEHFASQGEIYLLLVVRTTKEKYLNC